MDNHSDFLAQYDVADFSLLVEREMSHGSQGQGPVPGDGEASLPGPGEDEEHAAGPSKDGQQASEEKVGGNEASPEERQMGRDGKWEFESDSMSESSCSAEFLAKRDKEAEESQPRAGEPSHSSSGVAPAPAQRRAKAAPKRLPGQSTRSAAKYKRPRGGKKTKTVWYDRNRPRPPRGW